MGKFLTIVLVVCAALAGGGMYYLQVYAYYDRLPPQDTIALTAPGGIARAASVADFEGIDSDSSPIRYRACFTLDSVAGAALYEGATPLIAPRWFGCFDAEQLSDDLEAGAAQAVLSQSNFRYGFDRVVAHYPDGRAYAWHQINRCGEALFDGNPIPFGCPVPPPS
ncbi:DUF6446 family protein [Roseicitreum antarcticum]|uniref:Histidine kinase n=1 Tax=Roseicitreum antarcticum TaxID=564137 RepID=A0A1H2VLN6_9RHOB|nr:DUF6446 family protein [Roseicitreum antarcticum]SDW69188.1 hypothetical protein SAMN04488238_103110 [Roseicitreum antarcticum]